jgi:hypothetical protein
MCTQCLLLLAGLIFSAFPTSTQERGATTTSGVTIVERLRSELLSVLDSRALAAEDVSLPASRSGRYLTRHGGAHPDADSSADAYSAARTAEMQDGLRGARPHFRRGSTCWWFWLLFGHELCW